MNTYECKTDIIDINERKQLLSEVMDCDFHTYTTDKGTNTQLHVVSTPSGLPLSGLVENIIKKVNPKLNFFAAICLKFPPDVGLFIHTDDHPGRATCITWPLQPELKDYTPVKYYNSSEEYIETVHYGEMPLILNTTLNHSVPNNESEKDRICFQLCFYDPIETLAELDERGELFI
jgi:hypothetical protein